MQRIDDVILVKRVSETRSIGIRERRQPKGARGIKWEEARIIAKDKKIAKHMKKYTHEEKNTQLAL